MSGDSPSVHSATRRFLLGRRVSASNEEPLQPVRHVTSLNKVCRAANTQAAAADSANALPKVRQVLLATHKDEATFDKRLFRALGEDLAELGMPCVLCNSNLFVVASTIQPLKDDNTTDIKTNPAVLAMLAALDARIEQKVSLPTSNSSIKQKASPTNPDSSMKQKATPTTRDLSTQPSAPSGRK